MLVVVDKNMLETEELRIFLKIDPAHRALLIDFAGIEAYGGANPIKNVARSMSVVCEFPEQILVLKSARALVGMGYIDPNLRFDLIDWYQSRGFTGFCAAVERAGKGDAAMVAALDRHVEAAGQHLAMMRNNAMKMIPHLDDVRKQLGSAALAARRSKQPIPKEAGRQIIEAMLRMAELLFEDDPEVPKIEGPITRARNYYRFRVAVAYWLLALWWAERGGIKGMNPEKLRNDLVDIAYIASATYFDGLLTNDKRMEDIYAETLFFVEDFFGRQLEEDAA